MMSISPTSHLWYQNQFLLSCLKINSCQIIIEFYAILLWIEQKKNGILKTKLINMCILIFAPFLYKRHRTLYQKDWQPIFHIIHFIYSNNNCFQRLSSQRTRQYIYTMSVHLYNGYYNISLKIDALENSTELTDQCVCGGDTWTCCWDRYCSLLMRWDKYKVSKHEFT